MSQPAPFTSYRTRAVRRSTSAARAWRAAPRQSTALTGFWTRARMSSGGREDEASRMSSSQSPPGTRSSRRSYVDSFRTRVEVPVSCDRRSAPIRHGSSLSATGSAPSTEPTQPSFSARPMSHPNHGVSRFVRGIRSSSSTALAGPRSPTRISSRTRAWQTPWVACGRPASLTLPVPDLVDDAEYAVECAALGETSLAPLETYVADLERRLAALEARLWPRARRALRQVLRRSG